jgi:hypothetical protein
MESSHAIKQIGMVGDGNVAQQEDNSLVDEPELLQHRTKEAGTGRKEVVFQLQSELNELESMLGNSKEAPSIVEEEEKREDDDTNEAKMMKEIETLRQEIELAKERNGGGREDSTAHYSWGRDGPRSRFMSPGGRSISFLNYEKDDDDIRQCSSVVERVRSRYLSPPGGGRRSLSRYREDQEKNDDAGRSRLNYPRRPRPRGGGGDYYEDTSPLRTRRQMDTRRAMRPWY